jgi:hypothetical protein
VYDMYPWHEDRLPSGPPGAPAASTAPAVQAVQVALDRRDNGGDAAVGRPGPAVP